MEGLVVSVVERLVKSYVVVSCQPCKLSPLSIWMRDRVYRQ